VAEFSDIVELVYLGHGGNASILAEDHDAMGVGWHQCNHGR